MSNDESTPADAAKASAGEKRLFRFTLFMALLTAALTVGTPLIGLQSLHSTDILRQYDPWRSDASETPPQNRLLSDVVDVITPMHEEAKRRIADRDFPLYTSLPGGGMALGAVPDWSVTGPLDLPDMFLPSWYAPGLVKFIELLVALLFTALFLRLLGLGRAAATFGGMLFMNSGFMLISTNWPHDGVTTLIPAMFWGVERAIQRRTVRGAIPLALATAASLMQGYPSVTGYTLFFAAIYTVVRILAMRERPAVPWLREQLGNTKVLVAVGIGVAFGVALTAYQLLPFSHMLNDFYSEYRKQNPHRILPVRSLATIAIPDALGTTHTGSVYYGIRNYPEMQMFVGASAVVVVLAGLARLRRSMLPRGVLLYLWGATLGCGYLIYVGRTPLRILQVTMPTLFGFNFIGRMRSLLGFFLAWFAAVAFQAIVDRRGSGRWWIDVPAYAAGALGMVYGFVAIWRLATPLKQHHVLLQHTVVPAIATGIALVGVAGATLLKGRPRRTAMLLVPVALAIESVTFANGYLPRIDKGDFYPMTATHRYVIDHLGHERMAAAAAVMYPGTTTYYGIRSVSAHGFHAKSWHDMLLAAGARPRNKAPTLPLLLADDTVGESPVLDRLGAKYWVQSPDTTPPGTVVPGARPVGVTDLRTGSPVELAVHDLPRLRSVRVELKHTALTPDERAYVVAEALDARGNVVGRGTRRIFLHSLGTFGVTTSEPTAPVARIRVSVTGAGRPVSVAADAQGRPALQFVVGGDDGLREVFSQGAAVYERLNALPRIRWSPRSVVQTDATAQLAMLSKGMPRDTVLLGSAAPAGSGLPGTVTIEKDGGDALRVKVDAQGSGYLVVADAMQHGWHARIDGKPVPIVFADHAGVAVNVPKGTHTVTFAYVPSGWRTGVALTASTLLLILVIALRLPRYARRVWERRRATTEDPT